MFTKEDRLRIYNLFVFDEINKIANKTPILPVSVNLNEKKLSFHPPLNNLKEVSNFLQVTLNSNSIPISEGNLIMIIYYQNLIDISFFTIPFDQLIDIPDEIPPPFTKRNYEIYLSSLVLNETFFSIKPIPGRMKLGIVIENKLNKYDCNILHFLKLCKLHLIYKEFYKEFEIANESGADSVAVIVLETFYKWYPLIVRNGIPLRKLGAIDIFFKRGNIDFDSI